MSRYIVCVFDKDKSVYEAARAEIQADHDRRAAKLKGANELAAQA